METKSNIKHITSRSNDQFRLWLTLLTGAGIKKSGQFLLSGERWTQELIRTEPALFQTALLTADMDGRSAADIPSITLAPELFRELDVFKTKAPLFVGTVPTFAPDSLETTPEHSQLVTALGDPANLGALLRSAEAFGLKTVVLLKESSHPFHPKSLRASAGSALRLQFRRGPSIQELRTATNLVALDLAGLELNTFEWPKSFRLLVGQEGLGIPKELICPRVHIGMSGSVESLNGAIAGSIAAYSAFTQRASVR